MTAGVSATSLKVQCAMKSFSCHVLLDQSVTIFRNSFFVFFRALVLFINFFFIVSLREFRCLVLCVIFRPFVSVSLYAFSFLLAPFLVSSVLFSVLYCAIVFLATRVVL